MQTIPAANNLYIQTDQGVWRLFTGQQLGQNATPLIEASPRGLVYQEAFARARNLRPSPLPNTLIDMVIVGWAAEDSSWHLGVLFVPSYAEERGGRWCGLVRWPDTSASTDADTARVAGEALAQTLGTPFRFVQPEPVMHMPDVRTTAFHAPIQPTYAGNSASAAYPMFDASAEATRQVEPLRADAFARPPQPLSLPDVARLAPPITMGEWVLHEGQGGLVWEHSRGWRMETLGRTILFAVLTLLFGLLSFGELRSSFAPVQPDWLPIVGVVVTIIMAANTLFQLSGLILTSSVEFDRHRRVIRFVRRPRGVVKQVPFEKVENLLISQAILKRDPVRGTGSEFAPPFDRIAAEIWLHITRDKGDFWEIGHLGQVEGRAIRSTIREPRHVLRLDEVDTPVHQVAQLLAETMETPALLEDRA
jgi:hypothetical protein